jgi:hypothetical protein
MEMEFVNGENTMGIEIEVGGYLSMRSEVSWQDKRPVIPKTSHISSFMQESPHRGHSSSMSHRIVRVGILVTGETGSYRDDPTVGIARLETLDCMCRGYW